MNKSKITFVVGFLLFVAIFTLIDGRGSSANAAEPNTSNCVDAYAGGPDFLFNAKPDNLKNAYSGNCPVADNGPLFLVNAHIINSGSQTFTAECPQAETGAPTFIVNPKPIVYLSVAEVEGKCSPG